MDCKEYSKSDFINFWGDGYYGPSYGDGPTFGNDDGSNIRKAIVDTCILPFCNQEHTCLEIGPGGGFWTQFHVGKFKKSLLMDVIPISNNLLKTCNLEQDSELIEYIELDNCDYSCPIKKNVVDFVFCFGVFCHLPYDAVLTYLKNLNSKIKQGANLMLMFGCWDRHPDLKSIPAAERMLFKNKIHSMGWSYQDKQIVNKLLKDSGLNVINHDVFPDNRDLIIHAMKNDNFKNTISC